MMANPPGDAPPARSVEPRRPLIAAKLDAFPSLDLPGQPYMQLYLLDRDGVIAVNRPTNIKAPGDLQLIPGSARATARLNKAGYHVAICTNQPEVARGVITELQFLEVHDALKAMLLVQGARIESILCCTKTSKCPAKLRSGSRSGG
jgi:HAD superfamily hydrolase (TIGR01662 family)